MPDFCKVHIGRNITNGYQVDGIITGQLCGEGRLIIVVAKINIFNINVGIFFHKAIQNRLVIGDIIPIP